MNNVISLPEFSFNTNPRWLAIFALSKIRRSVDGKQLMCFRVELLFSNFAGVMLVSFSAVFGMSLNATPFFWGGEGGRGALRDISKNGREG